MFLLSGMRGSGQNKKDEPFLSYLITQRKRNRRNPITIVINNYESLIRKEKHPDEG
jgi:hypothetical protein